jgi:hypothetical protein
MNSPEPATAPGSPRPRSRLRFELIFASVWLAVGLFALPALIFLVGVSLLGPYGEAGAGLGRFYADFFADLAEPSGRAWALALGPLVLVSLVRAIFLGLPKRDGAPEDSVSASHNERPPASREHSRVEPRVELD